MPIAPADYEFIRELVRSRSGITLEAGKEYLVETRLLPISRNEGLASISELVARLRAGPSAAPLLRKVIEAMTTNETSFFRDIHPFEALRDHILPELLQARSATKTLSIWCAAASSGQEPYTIAIVLREHFPQLFNTGWRLQFIATDINAEMIRRCREGRYSQLEVNRGLPANLLVKYFRKHGMEWQVDESIRRMIDFRELNLCDEWATLGAPGSLDLVFMRNVLIYFSLETKRQILGKVRRLLKPDGYLFLGGAETTINVDDSYQRIQIAKTGIYRPVAAANAQPFARRLEQAA